MRYKFPLCAFFLLGFAAAGAQVASHAPTVFTQPPSPSPVTGPQITPAKPVARVNGSVLTEADLLREEYAIFPYGRQHNGIPKDLEPQIRAGALKMIVFEELVYQEALRRKVDVPAAKMQQAESDFRKQFATADEFNAFLQSDFHGSEQLLQAKIRRSLLIDTLLKSEVESKGKVSPAEVRAYYDKNPARFQHPESFTIQTISVIPPAKATAEQLKEGRKRADDALRQAKATKTAEQFGLLAEKISDDDFRVMMGQHKPMPSEEIAPQVLKALLALKPGDVSDVIQVEQIYTIVRLGAHTPAGEAKFDDVKAQLEKELPQTKKNQLQTELDKKLRQNAKVEEL
ncbi:MAG: peptidyl-prolyl cis-trans isomerase [Terracidiphilus sp.]